MATSRETLRTLEEKIKIKPGVPTNERALSAILTDSNAIAIAEYRALLRQWLIKNGIPERDTKFASDTSLVRSYCIPPYLRNWRNRVNPQFNLLGGDDDDEVGAESEAVAEAAAKPAPTAQEAAPAGGMSAAQSEKWLKDLWAQIDRSVNSLVTDKLNRTEVKLTDAVKVQIRQLGEEAAKAKIAELAPPRRIIVENPTTGATAAVGHQHDKFPTLLRACSARNHEGHRLNIWLTGPTGSGKTSACKAAAKALGLEFEAEGSLDSDFKLMGYMDGNGKYVETAFYRRVTHGGMILLDEIDNYGPSALLAANACLGNGFVQFPCGMVQKHPDCVIVAAANTWGLGATNDYVGRSRLDAATLDRFMPKINWPYDEKLERVIADTFGGALGLAWLDAVLAARSKAKAQGLKVIVSPRCTIGGIALFRQGFALKEVVEMTIGSGLSPEQFNAIGLNAISEAPFRAVGNAVGEATAQFFTGSPGQHPRHSEVLNFVNDGRLIDAIKTYKDIYDVGLLEAKNAVEALRDLREAVA